MSEPRWMLKMEMVGPFGERYAMMSELSPDVAQDIARIEPPSMLAPFEGTFDTVVRILRRKEMRRDLFKQEATRLGVLLAERMEDAEGWHDASRIEPAKKQLRGG